MYNFKDYITKNYETLKHHYVNYCVSKNYYGFDFEENFEKVIFSLYKTCHKHLKEFKTESDIQGYTWRSLKNETGKLLKNLYKRREDYEEKLRYSLNDEDHYELYNDDFKRNSKADDLFVDTFTDEDQVNKYIIDDAFAYLLEDIKVNICTTQNEKIVLMTYFIAYLNDVSIKSVNENIGVITNYRTVFNRLKKKIRSHYDKDLKLIISNIKQQM